MNEVRRYDNDEGLMIRDSYGKWVDFTDHERVVGELEQRVIVAEDEYVKQDREIETLRAALAASRAELAAKSKDAERYRWLQMQSPYRFKKIQDACVIDSVDVLYFKADRFNELLDAAMGDGNGR